MLYVANSPGDDPAPGSTSRRVGSLLQIWSVPHDAAMKTDLQCRDQNTGVTLVKAPGASVTKCSVQIVAGRAGSVQKVLAVSCR